MAQSNQPGGGGDKLAVRNDQPPQQRPKPDPSFLKSVGVEPLAAVGLIALDIMLFGGELATGGIGWAITGPIGFLAGLAIMFLQKSSYGDDWGAAIGKGLILGILTAIPTPLPSFVTGALGVAGYIGSKKD